MTMDINWFLEQRKIINEQFINIISKKESILTQDDDLAEFCIVVTDYLTASVLKLGVNSNFEFANNFSDKYAQGAKSWVELRGDLSKLILLLSEHWNHEDAVIREMKVIPLSI